VIAHERVQIRSRAEETSSISLDYLQKCHDYHEKWLLDTENELELIDANVDMNMNPETIQEWIQTVKNMVKPIEKHVEFVKVEFIDL
jgi:deoxyadenosine/deoxycytidine kinase